MTLESLSKLAAAGLSVLWFGSRAIAQTECSTCVDFGPAPMSTDSRPFVFCTKPGTMMIGDKCVQISSTYDAPGVISFPTPMPTCPQGYALLTYPGTWTPICARDLQAPE
jgi:hypothetical protein